MESDFSVFHRVDDIYSMPAPQFFSLAYRITAYGGLVARRAEAQAQASPAQPPAPAPATRRPSEARPAAQQQQQQQQPAQREKPLAAMAFSYPDLFERVTVPAPTE